MSARYTIETTGDVALSAATAKTVLSYIAASNAPFVLNEFAVSFDGTSASAEPCTVELCYSTQAGAGSGSSAVTPNQTGGTARTVQGAGARNYSGEPTTLTTWKRWLVHPQTGIMIQFPMGREPEETVTADALLLRVTAPATVNCQAYMEVIEG